MPVLLMNHDMTQQQKLLVLPVLLFYRNCCHNRLLSELCHCASQMWHCHFCWNSCQLWLFSSSLILLILTCFLDVVHIYDLTLCVQLRVCACMCVCMHGNTRMQHTHRCTYITLTSKPQVFACMSYIPQCVNSVKMEWFVVFIACYKMGIFK